jgi:hypothetical protein
MLSMLAIVVLVPGPLAIAEIAPAASVTPPHAVVEFVAQRKTGPKSSGAKQGFGGAKASGGNQGFGGAAASGGLQGFGSAKASGGGGRKVCKQFRGRTVCEVRPNS